MKRISVDYFHVFMHFLGEKVVIFSSTGIQLVWAIEKTCMINFSPSKLGFIRFQRGKY